MSSDHSVPAARNAMPLVFLYLFLGMAIFGSATPVSKIVAADFPVFVGAAIRVTLGALLLAPFAIARGIELKTISQGDWLRIGLIALIGMFGFTALMLYGMRLVSGVVGSIIMSTAPAITAGLAILFMGESATWRKVVALALAVAGIQVLFATSGEHGGQMGFSLLGAAMVLGAVICEAGYTLLGKRVLVTLDPLVLAFLAAAISVPLFLPVAVWQAVSLDWSQISMGGWLALLWYSAGTLALGSWLWYSGVAKAEGSVAAGFMGVMPVSALVLSYLLLGDPFRWAHLFGFAIVFTGVLLMSWEHIRQHEA